MRSHYERSHWVRCFESNRDVKSVIYDPNGNAMTYGELCDLINELQDENADLKGRVENLELRLQDTEEGLCEE